MSNMYIGKIVLVPFIVENAHIKYGGQQHDNIALSLIDKDGRTARITAPKNYCLEPTEQQMEEIGKIEAEIARE